MKSAVANVAARTALVLETNNLRGGDDLQLVAKSLKHVVGLLAQQTLPLRALAQVVITHDGLPISVCDEVQAMAGCPVQFVTIDATTGYYDAKNAGFDQTDASRCDYVAFADADCTPASDWLEQLLTPFTDAQRSVTCGAVAGRTSYASTLAGTALTTIDFMYFPSPLQEGATRNFYANNVVFKREVFAAYRYQQVKGVYRAHCQVLGLRLQADGHAVLYAPQAHTEHKVPDTRMDVLRLRWMRGQDSVGLTPFLVRSYMPSWLQWLAKSGPIGPWMVMMSRLVYSLRALNRQDMPRVKGLRWCGAVALVWAISSVDTLGAIVRGLGINTVGGKGGDAQALSYHGK